jgi:hypothetical protein
MQTRARVTSRSRFIAKRRSSGAALDIATSCPTFTSNTNASGSLNFTGHTINTDTFSMNMFGGTIVSVNGSPVNSTTYNGTITNLNTTFVLNVPLNGNYVLDITSSRTISVTCAGDGPRSAANITFACPASNTFDGFNISTGNFTFTSHTNTDTFNLTMTGGTFSTVNGITVNSATYTGPVVGNVIPFSISVPLDTNYTLALTTSRGATFNCSGTGGVSNPPNLVLSGGNISGNNLSFPDTVINTTSAALTFNITGTFVNFPVTIVSNSPRFTVNTASIPTPNGGNLSATPISVTFNPTAVQAYNSTITITCGPTVVTVNLNGNGIGICALSNFVGGTSPHSVAFAFGTPPGFTAGTIGVKRTNQVNYFNETITNSSSPHQFSGILSNTAYDWKTSINCGGSPVEILSDPIITTEIQPCDYGLSGHIEAFFENSALIYFQYPLNSTVVEGRWFEEGTTNYNTFSINSPITEYLLDYSSGNFPNFTKIIVELYAPCNSGGTKKVILDFYTGYKTEIRFNTYTLRSEGGYFNPIFISGFNYTDPPFNPIYILANNLDVIDSSNSNVLLTYSSIPAGNLDTLTFGHIFENTFSSITGFPQSGYGLFKPNITYRLPLSISQYAQIRTLNLIIRIRADISNFSNLPVGIPLNAVLGQSSVFKVDPTFGCSPAISFTYSYPLRLDVSLT